MQTQTKIKLAEKARALHEEICALHMEATVADSSSGELDDMLDAICVARVALYKANLILSFEQIP